MGYDKNKLKITMSSFKVASSLKNAVAKAIKGNGLKLPNSVDAETTEIDSFIDPLMEVISNDDIDNQLFECCKRVLYDNNQVDPDFFEKEENRELYYPIMFEVLKVNIGPFLTGLLSMFGGAGENLKSFLK